MDTPTPITRAPRAVHLPKPRRRLAAAPPAPADPTPWLIAFGTPPLGSGEVAVLQQIAHRRPVPAGESVFRDGQPARALVLLLSGDAVLGSRAADGSLRTERSVAGPSWLDGHSAWLGEPHAMEALALSDVVVAELPIEMLRLHLTNMPLLGLRFCANLAREVRSLTDASRNLLHNDAPARFARWLVQRCPGHGDSCELRLQERKRDIAQQLAMTPETLSRLMRTFESRGVFSVSGYNVVVHDLPALRQMAGEDH